MPALEQREGAINITPKRSMRPRTEPKPQPSPPRKAPKLPVDPDCFACRGRHVAHICSRSKFAVAAAEISAASRRAAVNVDEATVVPVVHSPVTTAEQQYLYRRRGEESEGQQKENASRKTKQERPDGGSREQSEEFHATNTTVLTNKQTAGRDLARAAWEAAEFEAKNACETGAAASPKRSQRRAFSPARAAQPRTLVAPGARMPVLRTAAEGAALSVAGLGAVWLTSEIGGCGGGIRPYKWGPIGGSAGDDVQWATLGLIVPVFSLGLASLVCGPSAWDWLGRTKAGPTRVETEPARPNAFLRRPLCAHSGAAHVAAGLYVMQHAVSGTARSRLASGTLGLALVLLGLSVYCWWGSNRAAAWRFNQLCMESQLQALGIVICAVGVGPGSVRYEPWALGAYLIVWLYRSQTLRGSGAALWASAAFAFSAALGAVVWCGGHGNLEFFAVGIASNLAAFVPLCADTTGIWSAGTAVSNFMMALGFTALFLWTQTLPISVGQPARDWLELAMVRGTF